MDPQLFLRYIKYADSFKASNQNIYFFLKDCGFQRVFRTNGNRFPDQMTQNMCNQFQQEMKMSGWQRSQMKKDEYNRHLNDFFKKINFNTIDLHSCEIFKMVIENLGIFGPFDDLTNKRIVYLNKKIESLKASAPGKPVSSDLSGLSNNSKNTNLNSNDNQEKKNDPTGLGLPDAKTNFSSNSKGGTNTEEDKRLNEIMRQMKLNSPVYITNMTPGQFYNPYTCPNYIPQGIDRTIQLPVNKRDPAYQKLKDKINEEIILANQELDYHKIDMARNHLERAAYYLKNVID
jgi:hypothetical protein